MTTVEKKIEKFDDLRIKTVFGFIRTKIFIWIISQDIPKEIILVCILFYGIGTDEWNPKYVPQCIKISDKTIINPRGVCATAYCKYIHESGIVKWRFKWSENDVNTNKYYLTIPGMCVIGIWNLK